MGTVKYTGPVASFHCPTNAEIRSLKVHFSPKQEGSGDPSPENVRPIVGWDGVETYDWTSANASTSSVPSEYKKVEYLESTGAQYIYTNVPGRYGIECRAKVSWISGGDTAIFGARKASSDRIMLIHQYPNNRWTLGYGASYTGLSQIVFNTIYDVESKVCPGEQYLKINNTTIYTGTDSTEYSNNFNMSLFACTNSSSSNINLKSSARIYSLSAKLDGVEVLNVVPCLRKSDNKPGMYDMVSQTFYTNAGTGEFLYGPEVSGYTENYEFGVLGKNKVPFLVDSKTISIQTNGNDSWCNIWKIPNRKLKYTYSADIDNTNNTVAANVTVWCKNIDNTSFVDGVAKSGTQVAAGTVGRSTITIDASILSNTYYFAFGITSFIKSGETVSCTFSNPMVEIGDTATEYEPYNPNHTVYGGWVDLITGEVQEEWYNVNPSKWIKYNESNGYYAYRLDRLPSAEVYSTTAGTQKLSNIISQYGTFNSSNMNRNIIQYPFYLALQQDISVEMMEYIYKLVTPITYFLAPIQLQTFLGQNNVWSNADYVEVEYDLHETQSILARKQFIIANQPHIITPAAAPLQNFVTDVPAPLKECKIYFEPMQEGSGDPNPNNVRAINGWTGVKAWRVSKNLIDESYLADGDNYPNAGSYGYYYTNDIQLVPNTRYRFVWYNYDNTALSELETTNIHLYVSGASEYIVNNADYKQYSSGFITPATGIIRLGIYHPSVLQRQDILDAIFNNGKLLLQVGTDDIAYEPYSGTTIPIDWTTEVGTVYGGYVDLVKGEIIAEYLQRIYDGSSDEFWTLSGNDTYVLKEDNVKNDIRNLRPLCDKFLMEQTYGTTFSIRPVGNYAYASNVAEWKAWLALNPIQVVYQLQTPIHYSITTQNLKTLRGTNNIWSTANGDVEIAYWTH